MRLEAIFRIPTVREFYAKIRFRFLTRIQGLRISENLEAIEASHYSKQALLSYVSISRRVNFLVSAVDSARDVKSTDTLLALGPRFESELYGYRSLGYSRNSIHALDTYSYSKLISTGNMHSMNYLDGTFDVVVGGWILAYSSNPIVAIKEIHRVTKNDGLAVLAWDLPRKIDNRGILIDNLFLPGIDGNCTPLSSLISGWSIHSLFVGNTSWSSECSIILIVLEKVPIK